MKLAKPTGAVAHIEKAVVALAMTFALACILGVAQLDADLVRHGAAGLFSCLIAVLCIRLNAERYRREDEAAQADDGRANPNTRKPQS